MEQLKDPEISLMSKEPSDIDLDEIPRKKIFSNKLKREMIAKRVAAIRGEALEAAGITTKSLYRHIGAMANSDIREIITWETPLDADGNPGEPIATIKNSSQLIPEIAWAIKEVRILGGEIRVKLYDKIKAIELAAQIKGLLKPTEPDDRPRPLIILSKRTEINTGGAGGP